MNYDDTSAWILRSSVTVLEKKIRSFPESDHPALLTWALKVQKDPTLAAESGIKWAVAILGTLAPELFDDDDDDILDAEVVE